MERRIILSALIAGTLLGGIFGAAIATWASWKAVDILPFVGSAFGAIIAVLGAVVGFHYQLGATDRHNRAKVDKLIGEILAEVDRGLGVLARTKMKGDADVRKAMTTAIEQFRTTLKVADTLAAQSPEIARCQEGLRSISTGGIEVAATSGLPDWNDEAKMRLTHFAGGLRKARAKLKI